MKLNRLLQQRSSLLRRTRLANIAFVFAELTQFGDRIARGKLRGQVTLYLADPAAQRAWPTLVADEGSQAVLEEHFLDTDILHLADLVQFAAEPEPRGSFTFRLEDFIAHFCSRLRKELEAAGIDLPTIAAVPEDRPHE